MLFCLCLPGERPVCNASFSPHFHMQLSLAFTKILSIYNLFCNHNQVLRISWQVDSKSWNPVNSTYIMMANWVSGKARQNNGQGHSFSSFFFLKRIYLFIYRERGREGEREGKRHQCVVASQTPLTRDLVHNPGMCPDWESNQWPFGLQPALSLLSYTRQCSFLCIQSHHPGECFKHWGH